MPETTTGRPLSPLCTFPSRPAAHASAAMASALLASACLLSGCATTDTDDSDIAAEAPRDPVVSLNGDAESDQASTDQGIAPTRLGDMLIDHGVFRELGQRWDWSVPSVTGTGSSISVIRADESVVYTLDNRNVLRLFSASDGTRRWGVEVSDPVEQFVGVDRADDRLLVSSKTELFVFTVDGGNLIQRSNFKQSVGTAPVRSGNTLIYGAPNGELLGFNYAAAGGQKAWGNANQRGPIQERPVLMGQFVGAVSNAGDIVFCDARTGQIVARESIFGGTAAPPATDGALMVVAGLDQSLWCFRPDGRLVWRHRTDRPIRGTPVVHDGVVYCELGDGSQISVVVSTGDVQWTTPQLGGVLVHASSHGLLFWDRDSGSLTLADTIRGDAIATARLDSVDHVFSDDLDGGNLYTASRGGIISKFMNR
jgi:outer membrane protein assembly factor BamB